MSNEEDKTTVNPNIKTDYEMSRDTYMELIEGGKRGLDLMIEVAKESEHPRAFEVLSGMIKNVADVTDKLMDLNKKHKEITATAKTEQKQITNNNVFLGSTSDLQRLLHDEQKVIEQDATSIPNVE
jgi:hypothetical protein|tara:strand:+ start:5002 stop:5379 length:378 start_codon:yes stop_codon:yes gene_type:complete